LAAPNGAGDGLIAQVPHSVVFSFNNCMMISTSSAFFSAHPGHELRIHGWLSQQKPLCFVLTTGARSGTDSARLVATSDLIESMSGRRASIFGDLLDRELYSQVLAGDASRMEHLVRVTINTLIANEVTVLVVDGWQLYSVSHDLAHVMGRIAAQHASLALKREITVLQYMVVPNAISGASDMGKCVGVVELSEDELRAKQRAIEGYPGIDGEREEIAKIEGLHALGAEYFFVPPDLKLLLEKPQIKPLYEQYGEERVQRGVYREVIRWRHVEAILAQLAKSFEI
jgi:hypothetical protein